MVDERICDLFKVEQLVNELVKDPAFREETRLKVQQALDMKRDFAFERMNGWAVGEAYEKGGHHFLSAWRKQASIEMQHLRETERRSWEHWFRWNDEPFVAARINMTFEITSAGESRISNMSSQLPEDEKEIEKNIRWASDEDITNILPITTPEQFAQGYKRPIIIPGKRFSLCEMPQIRCKPEHHPWLKDRVGLGPVKSSKHGD